jgi:cytochrome c oxidase subunit 4
MQNSHDEVAYRHMVRGPVPHVLPIWLYWVVFGALLGLTALTVFLADFDFGAFSIYMTLLIAGTKSALVLAVFMHLWFDSKFFSLVVGTSLIFLALFVIFPVIDLGSRGEVDPERDNFLPRDERVYEYELKHPNALPLRPGLVEAKESDLIWASPEGHGGDEGHGGHE